MKFEVREGSFSYHKVNSKDHIILDQISYEVQGGEILAILGQNGVGKTTLLRCSMGMLPWLSGGTYLDGQDIKTMSHQALWQRIAYVPQARGTVGQFTVNEMVLLGRSAFLKPWQQPGKRDRERARAAMQKVGIAHLAEKYCSRLSGGELQMVLIARALTSEPELLILDEPESNLDFRNQLIILDTMRKLTKEENISCIFNTHYPAHALNYADKALIVNRNQVSFSGSVKDVITEERLCASFGVHVHIHSVEVDGQVIQEVLPISIV